MVTLVVICAKQHRSFRMDQWQSRDRRDKIGNGGCH
jgi:hypothetical protein